MKEIIKNIYPYYQKIRHQIHEYPELRYEEVNTAKIVAQELEKLGLDTKSGIGKTGVVAILDSGKPGKTLALRADMDALPITEETSLPYRSKNPGKMHACGHDGHTASLLATAHVLCSLKEKLFGKIKFIFQPAEEGGAGAKAMIEDGVLENPKVDAIFAYHNHPGSPVGMVLAMPGCTMYSNTEFTINITGKGGHAAQPELAINAITIGVDVIRQVNEIAERISTGSEPTILTITQFNSGVATNVIPEKATITGTIRASSLEKSKQVQNLLSKIAHDNSTGYQAKIDLNVQEIYPPTINTLRETEFFLAEAIKLLGNDKVLLKPRSTRASEDFSFFLQEIPGCYFFIGNGENSACCHNSKYDFNDEVLFTAVELLSHVSISYLSLNQKL